MSGADPFEGLPNERREKAQRFMDELQQWANTAIVGGDALRVPREQVEESLLNAHRGHLTRIMLNMGYAEDEAEEVAASVRKVGWNGEAFEMEFDAPERVVAYIDAVRTGDFARADLLLHAREG